jgi:competence protein ComFC
VKGNPKSEARNPIEIRNPKSEGTDQPTGLISGFGLRASFGFRNSVFGFLPDALLGLLFPRVCQICGEERAGVADGFVGPKCWSGVRFIRPPYCQRCGLPFEGNITSPFECGNCVDMDLQFSAARSAVAAKGAVRDVIHRYKYQRALWFEPFLADLLVREAAPEIRRGEWDCLVPVPLHPTKFREREFNQAARLAAHLGRATGLPVRDDLLRRVRPTSTQTLLNRTQRAANMDGAFESRGGALDGERVVLVDDVFTTGATASACAGVLREAGAGDVCVWTVARGL